MVSDNTDARRYSVRAVWMLPVAALLIAVTVIVVRPWNSSAPSSSETSPQTAQAAGTVTVSIPVDGMICVVCASSVKRTAQAIDGVSDADVDLAGKRAKVVYVEGRTSPEQIAAAITRLGYKTGPPIIEKGQ